MPSSASSQACTLAAPVRQEAPDRKTSLRATHWPSEAPDRISELIAGIYDAALEPERWSVTLERVARFVGGATAALYARDSARERGELYHDSGCTDPGSRRLYCDVYARLDPTASAHVVARIDEPVATDDLIPYAELVETRFYQEWARPQGLACGVSAVLDKSVSGAAFFGVFWRNWEGGMSPDARARMRLVAPHVRRATLVGRTIDLVEARSASLSEAFDRVNAGVLIVETNGRLIEANRAGQMMGARGDAFRIANGILVTADPEAGALLREALTAVRHGEEAVGSKGVAIPLKGRSGERYVAHVLPLNGGRRRPFGGNRPACAVFLREAVLEPPSEPAVIASAYKLTPAELRVLLAIVEVGGVPEVAEALGVAETTVKTHLGRLFGKTGTSRQADLVKLVAGFSSPVLN